MLRWPIISSSSIGIYDLIDINIIWYLQQTEKRVKKETNNRWKQTERW